LGNEVLKNTETQPQGIKDLKHHINNLYNSLSRLDLPDADKKWTLLSLAAGYYGKAGAVPVAIIDHIDELFKDGVAET